MREAQLIRTYRPNPRYLPHHMRRQRQTGGPGGPGAAASLSKFPGLGKTAKKATTLYLMPTLMARVSRKLPGGNVSSAIYVNF